MKTKSMLGVVLGLAVISSGFYYIANQYVSTNTVSLSLHTETQFHKPGDIFPVSVLLISKQDVLGVDAFIEYDPAFLSVIEVSVGDSVFDDYPGSFKGDGVVAFSAGIKGGGEPFNGLGTVGAVTFKGISEGETVLKIRHEKGSTVDSNVAGLGGVDLLDSVKELRLVITNDVPKGK